MKEGLKKFYNQRKDLALKLENLNKMEYLREGKQWKEKMYHLVTDARKELVELDKKIQFIENLILEMESNEMFYKKK